MLKIKKLATAMLAVALSTGIMSAAAAALPLSLQDNAVQVQGAAAKIEYVDAACKERFASFMLPYKEFKAPKGYIHTKMELNGVQAELLRPKRIKTDRVVLQLHGGAYVAGLSNFYREMAHVESIVAGKAPVYMLNYRLAPKHPHPAALQDAAAMYTALLDQGYKASDIVLLGDSAGGHLAVVLAMYLRDQGMELPGAIVLQSPWTTMENTLPSRQENYYRDKVLGANASPLLPEVEVPSYAAGQDYRDPYLSPIYGNLKGLPPMLIQAGSHELLLDDSLELAVRAAKDDVRVQLSVYPYMPHVFASFMPKLEESHQSWKEIEEFLDMHM